VNSQKEPFGMPFYESVFIARQDIAAPQAEALADTFTSIIDAQGGKVTKRENWGLRNLAYKVKKNRKGHYILFNIAAPPAAIAEMERNMRIHEDVLRYMTVRVEELEEGPSAMVRSRGREDEREGGRGGRIGDRERRPRRDFGPRDGGPRDGGPRDGGPREGGRDGGPREGFRGREQAEEQTADQGDAQ
jgi:small subunit ribosomal protein S6